jgi:hypothetical protein
MSSDEKEFFDAPMDTVCPLGSKFNKIYFYKFLDQYTCLQGGPGQLRKQAGKSANLLKRFSGAGNEYRVKGGIEGSHQTPELLAALKTLGISEYSHGIHSYFPKDFANTIGHTFKNSNDQFVICHLEKYSSYPIFYESDIGVDEKWTSHAYPRTIKIGTRLFDLASAGVSIRNKDYKGRHAGHVITAYVDMYGKGYLFDSNQMSNYVRCDWWDQKKLEKIIRGPFISGFYEQFAGNNITSITYNNFVYVRRTFVSQVSLACRLKYRRLNFNTRRYMGYKNMNQLENALTRKLARGELTQAERAKIIKNFKLKKFNTSKYMNYNTENLLINSINRKTNLTNAQKNKIIKNYGKLTRFNVRNYLNTPNDILNVQVTSGVMTAAERKKIANAKKIHMNFEGIKRVGSLNNRTVELLEKAGYIITNATKQKVKRLLAKKAGGSYTPSPAAHVTGFTPSPPRKKPVKRRSPSVINLRTPTPATRSNPRTPTPRQRTPTPRQRTPTPVRSNPHTPTPVRSNPRTPTPRQRTPTPVRSNLDKAKSAVAKMKTIKERKAYRRTRAVNMSQANWTELGWYINMLNLQKRKRLENARQLKKKAKN